MNGLTIQLPIIGRVKSKSSEPRDRYFVVRTRGGTEFTILIKPTTWFDSVTNLDRLGRIRQSIDEDGSARQAGETPRDFEKNIKKDQLIAVEGLYYLNGEYQRYEATAIHVLHSHRNHLLLFEHTHWWKGQLEQMANKWLDVLFGEKRTYALDDFSALYRTTLNIDGLPTTDDTQEMATLSRLIYGLSSAYLIGGDERYFLAAKAGVDYQREAFRSYSADGRFCFWLHARKRDRYGAYEVLPSENGEDRNTIPLYEQIYALAGLAQFYRITNDRETLADIYHTLITFDRLYADKSLRYGQEVHDGFFSHIDPVTFRWDSPELDRREGETDWSNRARKNWNSVGDHLPAYLINLILALDPLPQISEGSGGGSSEHRHYLENILNISVRILEVTARLIHDEFPEEGNDFVNERFERDWKPVKHWGWQQNRAVVGHNLKIAWNLTRVANYYRSRAEEGRARELFELSEKIGRQMVKRGIDPIRSGVYDAVEREPSDSNFPVQFGWSNTKDFWQQEQGILAYSIMFGYYRAPDHENAQLFLDLARELSAFWNLYFLDRERNGIFFRVGDNGVPVLRSTYGDKGGHSISGYHAFELGYLAHIYQLAFLPRQQRQHTTFCLHFRPSANSGLSSINVLPDFLGPDVLEIAEVEIDGVPREVDPREFQIPLCEDDLGRIVKVYLWQSDKYHECLSQFAAQDDHLP
jgi:mannose/cellobiose epimerase-like protein (N-acyl-D-glucosamine 2-epimerase family)